MKKKVSKKGRGGRRSSGRDKREESKVAYGGNDMAISYLNKAKVEKSKINGNTDASNKPTSTINTNISADPTTNAQIKHPRELDEGLVTEKTAAVLHDSISSTIPEVSDSSENNAVEEMKEPIKNIMKNEIQSKEEISSDLQKEEKPVIEPANLGVDGSYPSLNNIDTSNNNSSLQDEQHQVVKKETNEMNFQRIDGRELEVTQIESRQNEIMLDNNQYLENNKGIAKVDGNVNKKEENRLQQQQPLQHLTNLPQYYIDLWHGSTNAWVDMYTEGVRNSAKVTEYWLDSFYKPGFRQKSNNQNDSVKIE
ncbi:MAG: hypothetical protein WAM88_14385 [Nitrososphaeraceae archaeon]